MKRILPIVLFACFTLSLAAQESTFNKGDKVLNLGVGLGSTLYTGGFYTSAVPPLSASYEVGIVDNIIDKGVIGIGGYLGFASAKYDYLGEGWRYTNIIIGPRGTFHYPFLDKLDTYTGLLIGYDIVSTKWTGTGVAFGTTSGSHLIASWFIGGRYYFSDKFAVMLELGYGVSVLNIGVALKM